MENSIQSNALAKPRTFSEEFERAYKQSMDGAMQRAHRAQRITCPMLNVKAEEFAKRLGIKAPSLYLTERFSAMHGGPLPQAMAVGVTHSLPGIVVFNQALLSACSYVPHTNKAVTPELAIVLGHEMGHVWRGMGHMVAVKFAPVCAGAAAGLAGLAMWKHLKSDDQKAEGSLEQIRQNAAKLGEYTVAAGMGAYGGLHATRQLMLNAEYEADQIGAELCGNPRALKDAFKSMQQVIHNTPPEVIQQVRKETTPLQQLCNYFFHAHPTNEQRYARLEKMAKQMEAGTYRWRFPPLKEVTESVEKAAEHTLPAAAAMVKSLTSGLEHVRMPL